MLAYTFDYGQRAAIAHGETLAGAPRDVKLTGSGAVENSVAGEDIATAGRRRTGRNRDGAARHPFANVVVGFPRQPKGDTIGEKRTKALPCRTRESLRDFLIE